jgi:WD40 repeat protein
MNIVQLLGEREQHNANLQLAMENAIEDSFIAGHAEQFDNSMPRSVSSTIAIAMSCDGKTFATTHGDHTVKIFDFTSGEQLRNFSGHPRTPWTLKYHPTDPNIVASGCLGFQVGSALATSSVSKDIMLISMLYLQVRVWDIQDNACLNLIVFSQTIISLAFHPNGDFIAVACGMRIEMWEWQVPHNLLEYLHDNPQQPHDTKYATKSKYLHAERSEEEPRFIRGISHKRNIRAVVFHPSGNYFFAVAPDTPKTNNEDLAHCRYAAVRECGCSRNLFVGALCSAMVY